MLSISRAVRALLLALSLVALPLQALAGQAGQVVPAVDARTPWLYQGSDVPQDPEWRFGVLPNGVRYALRRNGVPPGQVAIRVRIDAGSLMEKDSERGFAHLIEHLSFRGSEHVADGESKRIWQRLGATFGTDSNAQTTFTDTVYKLDLPGNPDDPVSLAANTDESLRILEGMVSSPTLSQAALDSERPVVMAEEREAPGSQVRTSNAMLGMIFAGQPLADRMPIGTRATLAAATPEAVKAFHDRWYRPDRAVVVVVGDLDPAVLEQLVVKNFSDWHGIGPAPADPDFGKPVATAPKTRMLIEPDVPPTVLMAVVRPWTVFADTIIFNQKRMVDMVALRIMNRRLETRARLGASYLAASASLDDVSRSANVTTLTIRPIGENWEAAVRDVRAVIADAMANPPTQAQIDREIAEMDAGMKQDVATWPVTSGAMLADNMADAVDIHETMTSAEKSYSIFRGAVDKKMFNPASVLESSKHVFQGTATRALLVTNKADPHGLDRLAAALTAHTAVAARGKAQGDVTFAALPALGAPAAIIGRKTVLAEPLIEQVDFANGVRLLLRSTPSERSKVYVRVRFGDGLHGLPSERLTPAWTGNALLAAGIGPLGQDDLDLLTGNRQIGFDFAIDTDAYVFGAQTTAGDLGDQLQLFATKLQAPGWDARPLARMKAAMLSNLAGVESSPDGVMSRDLERLLHDGDQRWGMPSRTEIEALTPAAFRAFWEPRLATGGQIEVEVFGDVDSDAAIHAVASTLGALPPRDGPPAPAVPVRFPAHVATPVVLHHHGQDDQAAAVIAWPTGGGSANIREMRKLDVLAAVFRDRIIERLRSQAGVSYSPNVDSDWPLGLNSGGRITAMGLVPPDKTDFFFSLSREIAADLAAHPIDADELRRTLAPMTQLLVRRSTGNTFWMQLAGGGTRDPARLAAIDTVVSDVATTTPAEVQALAAKYLRPEKDWTMVVLPTPKAAPAKPVIARAQAKSRARTR